MPRVNGPFAVRLYMPGLTAVSNMWAMHPSAAHTMVRRAGLASVLPASLNLRAQTWKGDGLVPAAATRLASLLIVPIAGMLAPRGFDCDTDYDTIIDQVSEGATDPRVRAIILAIRSPGGYVWGCAEAAAAIYRARAVKPVVAVVEPFCFSAAYWLATQATSVVVTQSGDVGSVGVRAGHVDMSGFERKIGMVTTPVASAPDKILAHQHAPLSDTDRAELQAGVDEAHRTFVAAIARGRRMAVRDVARVHGSGGTFSARRALAAGAIDGIGTLRETIARYA